jgi:hypothetical protein
MIAGLVAVLGRYLAEVIKLKAYAVALYAAAAASLAVAFVFVLVSVRHWIVVTYGSNYPDLWLALAFVVITAILAGSAVYMQRKEPTNKPAADLALLAGPPAAKFAMRRLRPRTVAVGVVLIAGLVIGRRMTHRSSA